jgi:hypothetical protein
MKPKRLKNRDRLIEAAKRLDAGPDELVSIKIRTIRRLGTLGIEKMGTSDYVSINEDIHDFEVGYSPVYR